MLGAGAGTGTGIGTGVSTSTSLSVMGVPSAGAMAGVNSNVVMLSSAANRDNGEKGGHEVQWRHED